jgi:AcrR family transcriptional regulator
MLKMTFEDPPKKRSREPKPIRIDTSHLLDAAKIEDPPKKRARGPKPIRVDPSHLLDAAQNVFARNGLDHSSIRAIAQEAGCDPSLFYYHFENKQAIFAALLDRKFDLLIPDLEKIAENFSKQRNATGDTLTNKHGRTQLQEAIWQTMMVFFFFLKDDDGYRSMICGRTAVNQGFIENELKRHLMRSTQIFHGFIKYGVVTGELRGDINVVITTFIFMRMCIELMDTFPIFGSAFLSMPIEEAIPLAELQWFNLFWAGIANTSNTIGATL